MAEDRDRQRQQRLADVRAVRGLRRQRAVQEGTLFGPRSTQVPNRRREQSRRACRNWRSRNDYTDG